MDRLSALPDELLHKILSTIESDVAAQTCVLSKRWVNLWSTLTSLNFDPSHFDKFSFYYRKFVRDFIAHRNRDSDTSSIKMDFAKFDPGETKDIFDYAISHNVEEFHVCHANFHCELSFPMLTYLSFSNGQFPLSQWSLPSLTHLHLQSVGFLGLMKSLSFPHLKTLHLAHCKVPFVDWTCLSVIDLCIEHVTFIGDRKPLSFPVLKTLRLTHCQVYLSDWSLPSLIKMHLDNVTCLGDKNRLSFGVLETLHISSGKVPLWSWSLPVLSTLHLEKVCAPGARRRFGFERFNQLKHLTLVGLEFSNMDIFVITYTVTSLIISKCICVERICVEPPTCNVMIQAPNLSFFMFQGNCVPRFPVEDCLSQLIQVVLSINIGKYDWKGYKPDKRKQVIDNIINMFHAFQAVKFLDLCFMTIKVLSRIPNFSEYKPVPFRNLDCLKVLGSTPQSERLMEIPANVLSYLLSSSPAARIFIKDYLKRFRNYDPRTNILIWSSSGYCVAKKSMEDTATDTESIVSNNVLNPEEVNKKRKVCSEAQQATSNVQINGDGIDRVLRVKPPAIVRQAVNDKACSCSENNSFSVWEGHQVYSEYVDLLARIKDKHPETFDHFTPRTEIMYTVGLNTLGGTVKALSEDTSTSFTASSITSYRDLFADLEKFGFNTTWLVNHLSNADRPLF